MATKSELEAEIAELKARPTTNPDHIAALQAIAKLGGRQGAIATEALKV